jgi:hypothetical protein
MRPRTTVRSHATHVRERHYPPLSVRVKVSVQMSLTTQPTPSSHSRVPQLPILLQPVTSPSPKTSTRKTSCNLDSHSTTGGACL